MLFVGNLIGVIMIGISVFASFIIGGNNAFLSCLSFGLACMILDLIYRFRKHKKMGKYRFIKPNTGGSFFFAPVWVIGLLIAAGTLYGLR